MRPVATLNATIATLTQLSMQPMQPSCNPLILEKSDFTAFSMLGDLQQLFPHVSNFMLFQKLNLRFSDSINIIFGDNSTGKTALLKLLYAQQAVLPEYIRGNKELLKEEYERSLVQKLTGVFKPDKGSIGRLAYRKQGGSTASVSMKFSDVDLTSFSFTNMQSNHIDISALPTPSIHSDFTPVYIPPKEIISSAGSFRSLYERFEIGFDETYYDLAKLLQWPLRRGANTDNQNTIINSFADIMHGNVVRQDEKFYLKMKGQSKEKGNFEMGLVSEGYRKLSTLGNTAYIPLFKTRNRKTLGKNAESIDLCSIFAARRTESDRQRFSVSQIQIRQCEHDIVF